MSKMKRIIAAVLFISTCVRAEVVQFGGRGTESPYAGATHVVEWNGVYTNLTNASGSSGNGWFDNAGAGAALTCPDVGLVLTVDVVTQDDGLTPGTMNAGTRIGIDGGRSSSINPAESITLSFSDDVELKAFNFQAITALDLYELSWNSSIVTNVGDYTFSPGVVLNAGSTLTLRGLVSGGDLADVRTDSFNFESLTVESLNDPLPSTNSPPAFATNLLFRGNAASEVIWSSVPGRTYYVEYSDDLVTWQPLPGAESLLASGIETGIIDSNGGADIRFYRVGVFTE